VAVLKRLSVHTAAFLLASSLSLPAVAQDQANAPASAAAEVSSIHIDNFGRISDSYYRGGQPKGADYAALAALGVKTIVNLTSDDADTAEQALAEKAGLHYVQIPMTTRAAPTIAELTEFLSLVNDPVKQPVYVHCVGGRHRTGVMTAAYRMTHDGWNADQAFKEMKQFKFGADFLHPEFKRFVYDFATATAQALTSAASASGAGVRPTSDPRQ
jgi:protein tyrosine/serine phosphatase